MMRDAHQKVQRTIAAHFSSGGSAGAEQEMRQHLRTCPDCLDCYQRHLIIAEVDPTAVPAEERIARGLGLPTRRARPASRSWFAWGALAGAAAAGVAVLTLMVNPPRDGADADNEMAGGGFAARGLPVTPTPEITIYRMPLGDARPQPAAGVVSSGDELAFAYRNPTAKGWLLIFAVDEHGHVYWYHPGWSDVGQDPGAVAISGAPGLHELPTAVAHKFDSTKIVLHALFTARRLTVREVEAAVRASAVDAGTSHRTGNPAANLAANLAEGVLAIPEAVDIRRPFKVVP